MRDRYWVNVLRFLFTANATLLGFWVGFEPSWLSFTAFCGWFLLSLEAWCR